MLMTLMSQMMKKVRVGLARHWNSDGVTAGTLLQMHLEHIEDD